MGKRNRRIFSRVSYQFLGLDDFLFILYLMILEVTQQNRGSILTRIMKTWSN